jgi:ABC-type sugar transport system permease subunit/ABC-type glycerol-3-phosphate transport system substrate-binding protein
MSRLSTFYHKHFCGCAGSLLALSAIAFATPVLARGGHLSGVSRVDGQTVITVRVFGLPDPTHSDVKTRADVAAVRMFRERFPEIFAEKYRERYKSDPDTYGHYDWDNVAIRLEPFSSIAVEGVESDLLAIAGGVAPDVLYINFRKSDNYIRNNFLYPLDAYFDTMTQQELEDRINPKLWPVIRRVGPDGVERTWAMPYDGALGKVLLFRKDLFEEHGIPFPDNDWTWEDMLDAARRITDPVRGHFGLLFGRGKHESWHWITFLWSAGGSDMVYDRETDQWRTTFDCRQAARAVDFYVRLSAERWVDGEGSLRRGFADKDSSTRWMKWERGEIGMRFAYVDEKLLSTINPDLVGMVPVPLGPVLPPDLADAFAQDGLLWNGRTRGGELNSRMMGLFSGIGHPAVRDAAWEYIRFYDSEEATAIKLRIMVEGGLGRFINPSLLRRYGYAEIEKLSPPGWADTFALAIKSGRPEPYGRNSNFAYEMMTFPIQEVERLALRDLLPEDEEARLDFIQEILVAANRRANEVMIGTISSYQRKIRRSVAALVIAIIVFAFTLIFRRIVRMFTPVAAAGTQERAGWAFARYRWAYMLLLPAALSVLFWQYLPLARGSIMAFQDYRLIGPSSWVWLDNFGDVMFSPFWWRSIWNSLRYSFLVMSMTFMPPIILAILLQEVPRGKILFRTIFYLPAVVTGLVTILLWKQLYDPSEAGALNNLVMRVPAAGFLFLGIVILAVMSLFMRRFFFHRMFAAGGVALLIGVVVMLLCWSPAVAILFPNGFGASGGVLAVLGRLWGQLPEPYRWLGDRRTAMLACVVPMVWAGMGPGCLIYLAALKGIPDEYYEAADMDGATFLDKIMFIVFPNLKMLILINFVGVFINSWYGATGAILAMTGGGAGTEVAGLHIWYEAFTYLRLGPATAMAWMLGCLMIGFTVNQLRLLSKVEFRTTGTS